MSFELLGQLATEIALRCRQRDSILRTARPGHARHDAAQVELERVGIFRLGRIGRIEQALRLAVRLDQLDLALAASRQPQISERLIVDRKISHRRAVLGRHVAERRAIGHRQRLEARPEIFDELADHAFLAQHLRDRQHQVGRSRAGTQRAGQPKADHFGNQHRHRAPKHRRFGFDSTDAPADDAEPVDHRRMRIGADHGVGIRLALVRRENHRREIFEIHLVHDAGVGRHDAKIVEGALPPAQEKIALLVALELQLRVGGECAGAAERIDLHRMIDHQINRLQRTDLGGIAAELLDRVAHHGEIRDHRHAREILQQHASRHERHFALPALAIPPGERFDLPGRHDHAVLAPQHVLDHHLDRIRHPREREAVLLQRLEFVNRVRLAIDRERRASAETICRHW